MEIKSLFLYPKQVQQLIGVSPKKFYELIELEGFPKARRPGMKRKMYLREEIELWAKNLASI